MALMLSNHDALHHRQELGSFGVFVVAVVATAVATAAQSTCALLMTGGARGVASTSESFDSLGVEERRLSRVGNCFNFKTISARSFGGNTVRTVSSVPASLSGLRRVSIM